jgi:uncharacterized protein (DUF488 family)
MHTITQLVDIRTIPKSRHNPQYGQDELAKSLKNANIEYVYLQQLGGLRPAIHGEKNDGWHNPSFRNYADYMQSDEFTEGLDKLINDSSEQVTAIMCAEAVPWRCHRSLVSDALLIRHISVCEIISANNVRAHTVTSFAVVHGKSITYPVPASDGEH